MRNIDFTIAVLSLTAYFVTNRFHYNYAMKSYEDIEKAYHYSKLNIISKVVEKIFIMFLAFGLIGLTFSLKQANLISYLIAILTIGLIFLAGNKANEKLLDEAYNKINKLK